MRDEIEVDGFPVRIETRAAGPLGWTWSYQSRDALVTNPGPLLPSRDEAFAQAARAAAGEPLDGAA